MKKILLLLFIGCILFSGCASCSYVVGESENRFIEDNKKCFRQGTLTTDSQWQNGGNRYSIYRFQGEHAWFYYFTDGILTQMDRGEKVPNYILERRER